jgi:hypothetical protein
MTIEMDVHAIETVSSTVVVLQQRNTEGEKVFQGGLAAEAALCCINIASNMLVLTFLHMYCLIAPASLLAEQLQSRLNVESETESEPSQSQHMTSAAAAEPADVAKAKALSSPPLDDESLQRVHQFVIRTGNASAAAIYKQIPGMRNETVNSKSEKPLCYCNVCVDMYADEYVVVMLLKKIPNCDHTDALNKLAEQGAIVSLGNGKFRICSKYTNMDI